jgi:hypothetical protein
VRNWSQVVKFRKAWNDVAQNNNNNPCKVGVEEEEKKKKEKSLWLNYALLYLLNIFKHSIIY